MSLESWAEKILDKSFFARAVRKSTGKSIVLGWLDAIQNPNAVLSEVAGAEPQGTQPPDKTLPPAPSITGQPVALPRPMLLATGADQVTNEPDRPGVPPMRVRKGRKRPHESTEEPIPPAGSPSDEAGKEVME